MGGFGSDNRITDISELPSSLDRVYQQGWKPPWREFNFETWNSLLVYDGAMKRTRENRIWLHIPWDRGEIRKMKKTENRSMRDSENARQAKGTDNKKRSGNRKEKKREAREGFSWWTYSAKLFVILSYTFPKSSLNVTEPSTFTRFNPLFRDPSLFSSFILFH